MEYEFFLLFLGRGRTLKLLNIHTQLERVMLREEELSKLSEQVVGGAVDL